MHLEDKKKIKSRLSGEELEKLTQILNLKYAHISGERFFTIEDENSADVILMRVILKNTKESFYYPVEGRIKKDGLTIPAKEAALCLIDYIDYYFDEFFQTKEETTLPIDWHDFSYEGLNFQLRGQVINRHSEKLADGILKH